MRTATLLCLPRLPSTVNCPTLAPQDQLSRPGAPRNRTCSQAAQTTAEFWRHHPGKQKEDWRFTSCVGSLLGILCIRLCFAFGNVKLRNDLSPRLCFLEACGWRPQSNKILVLLTRAYAKNMVPSSRGSRQWRNKSPCNQPLFNPVFSIASFFSSDE